MQLVIGTITLWVMFFYGYITKTPDLVQLIVGMLASFLTGATMIAWFSQRTSAKAKMSADAQIANWQGENLKLLYEIELLEKENLTLQTTQPSTKAQSDNQNAKHTKSGAKTEKYIIGGEIYNTANSEVILEFKDIYLNDAPAVVYRTKTGKLFSVYTLPSGKRPFAESESSLKGTIEKQNDFELYERLFGKIEEA